MTISPDGETVRVSQCDDIQLVACSKRGNVYVWKYSEYT